MGRGLISGIFWGAIVGVFIVVLASQMAVQQDLTLPRPNATPVEVPVGTEFNQPRPESNPVVPGTDATPSGEEVALAPLSPAGDVDTPPNAETESGSVPVTGGGAPESGDAPVEGSAPEIEIGESEEAPVQEPVETVVVPSEAPGVSLPQVSQEAAPAAPAPAAPSPTPPTMADNATETVEEGGVAASEDDTAPERIAPGGLASLTPEDTPTTPDALPQADPGDVAEDDTPAVAEPIGVPVPPAEELAPQVRTNRLPQIGGAQSPDAENASSPVIVEDVAIPDEGALRAFRRGFENPDDRPVLSIVLVHENGTDLDTVVGLPFPVSVAVDAANPNASEVAKKVRASGGEVVMIPALPEGGAPADIEVALQSNITMIPEAVALMDIPGASFQSNRAAVTQIVAAVADSGHALVIFPRGLNTAQKLAERDGIPTGLVFRDLMGATQGGGDIARTLDQAAFRARQQSSVILVGAATPETITALTEWALGNRAATVAIAPVSAAILNDDSSG